MSRSNTAGPKAELIDCWRWRPPMENDLTLKEAALKLGFVSEAEFDRAVDPKGEALRSGRVGQGRRRLSTNDNCTTTGD